MAITQLTTFELTSSSTSLTSPPLNHLLTSLCARQSVYSAYPVTLYTDLHSSGVFYLLSGWRDPSSISTWRKDLEDVNTVHGGACNKLRDFVNVRTDVYLDMDFDRIPRGVQGNGRVLCVLRNLVGGLDAGADDGEDDEDDSDEVGRLDSATRQGRGLVAEVSGRTGKTDGELSLCRRSEIQKKVSDEGVVDSGDSDESDDDDEEPCRIEWIGGGHDLRILEQQPGAHCMMGRTFHSFMMYNEGTSERALQGRLGRRIRSRDFTAMKRLSIPRPVMGPTDQGVGYSFRSSK